MTTARKNAGWSSTSWRRPTNRRWCACAARHRRRNTRWPSSITTQSTDRFLTMSVPARLLILVAVAFGANPIAAEALKFELLPTSDNRQILLIHDCGKLVEDLQFGSDGKVVVDKTGRPLKQ